MSKSKNIQSGVGGKSPKAPMVDKGGAFQKVQQRTLKAKCGTKMSKKK